MRVLRLLWLAFAIAFTAVGCSSEDGERSSATDEQTECVPGAARCFEQVAQRCDGSGSWQDAEVCAFGCDAGACTGSCMEETQRCSEGVVQRCEGGEWKSDETCPFVCADGRCAGECVPGEAHCDGLQVQHCEDGFWRDGASCPYACSDGSCVGICTPGTRQCDGNGVQECDAAGAWQTVEICPYACSEGACVGACEPGSVSCDGDALLRCDEQAAWETVQICPAGCDAGACTAECATDESRCLGDVLQRCDESGAWANAEACALGCSDGVCFACEPGAARCDGELVQRCDESGHWSAGVACAAGMQCIDGACEAVAVVQSCLGGGPGLDNCGPSGKEDCCATQLVPGGTFFQDNLSNYPASLSSFRLDRYEVTVGRFRKFVEAMSNGWRPQAGDGRHLHLNGGAGLAERGAATFEAGWNPAWTLPSDWKAAFASGYSCNWTDQVGANENLAINCIHWQEAYAFCIWDGGFLPSEAEWNYAAAGGSEQRVYPWGGADPSTGDYAYTADSCTGWCSSPDLVGVHPMGIGRWGNEDMAGNAAEWVLDWYRNYTGNSCVDCVSLSGSASFHGMRGGAHWDPPGPLISTENRYYGTPNFRVIGAGVRCARMP